LCLANAHALLSAIYYCHKNKIGSFRVNSRILPLKTHPDFGYEINSLAQAEDIISAFMLCGTRAEEYGIRLTFHPDQFVLLSSPNKDITRKSIQELEYQAEVCEWIGADVINIHGGGGYGDKKSALERVAQVLDTLSNSIRERLTFENDDRIYTPVLLLPFCKKNGVPFVYDVHHHRCSTDQLSVEHVTEMALKTWNREPLFHISSPKFGWKSSKPAPHHEYINQNDFPLCWRGLNITVEVEAKAKELAVKKLLHQLSLKTEE
jgi:UV DNA damage endonuclease